jgi:two-component system CheB/CheR fusion protein
MRELSILVVEDQAVVADSMVLLLEKLGYKPVVVYEGKHAIKMASTFRVDVVFLDIRLPDIDGFEVARQLRRMPEHSKTFVVAITGYGEEADIQRFEEVGIDLHLLKPVEPETIKQVLTSWEQTGSGYQKMQSSNNGN